MHADRQYCLPASTWKRPVSDVEAGRPLICANPQISACICVKTLWRQHTQPVTIFAQPDGRRFHRRAILIAAASWSSTIPSSRTTSWSVATGPVAVKWPVAHRPRGGVAWHDDPVGVQRRDAGGGHVQPADVDQDPIGRRLGQRPVGHQDVRPSLRRAVGQPVGDAQRQAARPAAPRTAAQRAAVADDDVLGVEFIRNGHPGDGDHHRSAAGRPASDAMGRCRACRVSAAAWRRRPATGHAHHRRHRSHGLRPVSRSCGLCSTSLAKPRSEAAAAARSRRVELDIGAGGGAVRGQAFRVAQHIAHLQHGLVGCREQRVEVACHAGSVAGRRCWRPGSMALSVVSSRPCSSLIAWSAVSTVWPDLSDVAFRLSIRGGRLVSSFSDSPRRLFNVAVVSSASSRSGSLAELLRCPLQRGLPGGDFRQFGNVLDAGRPAMRDRNPG